MANERLADLTEADVLEIRSSDPRVQLMERLYNDPEAKRAIQQHSKRLFPKASIPEIDVPALTKAAIAEDVKAIQDLRKELETDKQGRRHTAFRGELVDAGADEEDLDAIETFMVDNELGPKAVKVAVEKFYESKEIAEPRGSAPDFVWDVAGEDGLHMKALLDAPPGADLDRINEPYAEKLFHEMFSQPARGRRAVGR